MTTYIEALKRYQNATQNTVQFQNENYTEEAIEQEQIKQLSQARQVLFQDKKNVQKRTHGKEVQVVRKEILEALAVADADTVAISNNEWAKVKTLLESGRDLAHIIDNAEKRRLISILDNIEVELGMNAPDAKSVIVEVEDRVLERLEKLGYEPAIELGQLIESERYETAWAQIIDEVAVNGKVTLEAKTALYNANADEYRAAFSDEPYGVFEVEEKISNLNQKLNAVVGSGASDDSRN